MVIILRTGTKFRFFASIRNEILLAFFLVVGLSFLTVAANQNMLVKEYLLEQQQQADLQLTQRWISSLNRAYEAADSGDVCTVLEQAAQATGGRFLVLDAGGKVQFDSSAALCGRRLNLEEARRVLLTEEATAYGTYGPETEAAAQMTGNEKAQYLSFAAQALYSDGQKTGALLFVNRIGDMILSQQQMQKKINETFVLTAILSLLLALLLSHLITSPLANLTRTMKKMGKGDFSLRVPEKGNRELRELAANYNLMAEQLENLDQARNKFVSDASHELKTPLSSMKILLESMIYDPNPSRSMQLEFMKDIDQEIDRLSQIITDLLALSRADSEKNQGKKEEVDLSALTLEVVHLLQVTAEKRGQQIHYDIEPMLDTTGDRLKLHQVLYNLIENALKYSGEGMTVEVQLFQREGKLLWQIRDHGIGIPAEDLQHVFDRFYRVDRARSRDTGGNGLGLSIVKSYVQLHGGTVSVSSDAEEGTVFTVVLPRGGKQA